MTPACQPRSTKPNPIAVRMAREIAEKTANGSGLTFDEFAAQSEFTRAEIEKFGPEAIDLAKQAGRTQ